MGLIANLKGSTGATGPAGTNGTNGTNGATWYTGSGVPADTLGVDNDLYLDVDTSNVYKKVAGTWA